MVSIWVSSCLIFPLAAVFESFLVPLALAFHLQIGKFHAHVRDKLRKQSQDFIVRTFINPISFYD
jgi:hypothetical protein